jgi:hypothetical protein
VAPAPPRRLTLKRAALAADKRGVPSYEPEVIELFAVQLERRARAVRRGFTLAGLALGAIFGSFPLTSLGAAWPIPHVFGFATLLVGAAIGAFIGWVVGEGRAAMYRLHAQTTLCQLHAQRTTLAIWRLLQDRHEDLRAELPRLNAVEREVEALVASDAIEVSSERDDAVEASLEDENAHEVYEAEESADPEPEPVFAPAARLAPPPQTPTLAAVEPPGFAAALRAEAPEVARVPEETPPPFVPVTASLLPSVPGPVPLSAVPREPFVPISVPEAAPATAPVPVSPPPVAPFVPVSAPSPAPFAPSAAPAPSRTHEQAPSPSVAAQVAPSALRQAGGASLPIQPPPLSD